MSERATNPDVTEDEVEQSSAPLIEHLAELRTRLIRSVSAFFVAMVLCFFVAEPILDLLVEPIDLLPQGRQVRLVVIVAHGCTLVFILLLVST